MIEHKIQNETEPAVGRPRLRALLLGLAYSMAMGLAFEPVGLWAMVLVAPLPLMMLAARPGCSASSAALFAAIGSGAWWAWSHNWVGAVSSAGLVPLVIVLGALTGVFVWVAARVIARRPGLPVVIVLPVLWVGMEFFRGRLALSGYPWYLVAHPMIEGFDARLAWPAATVGTYGVSLLVTIPAAVLVSRRVSRGGGCWCRLATGLLVAAWLIGAAWTPGVVRERDDDRRVRVAVVQTDVPQSNKLVWDAAGRLRAWWEIRDLMVEAGLQSPPPDVIVVPEAMFPGRALDAESLAVERAAGLVWRLGPGAFGAGERIVPVTTIADELMIMQRRLGIPIIIGAPGYDGLRLVEKSDGVYYESEREFNSAMVLVDGSVLAGRYDKVHLTPFGEVMPIISRWGWLEKRMLAVGAGGMRFVLSPGDEARVLRVPAAGGEVVVAAPICFEATLGQVCRRLVRSGGDRPADVMVNLTNDGWFGSWDAGRAQHLQTARWRCVELGRPMVRAANTGFSAHIDSAGRVVTSEVGPGPGGRAGVLVSEVALPRGVTVYLRAGDVLGWACFGALAGLIATTIKARRAG